MRELGQFPDPSTMLPDEVGDWVGRIMFAFSPSDPRSEFVRQLALRIKQFDAPNGPEDSR